MKQFYAALVALLIFISSFAQNPIVTENALTGNPVSEWGVPNFRDTRIAGFSTKMSLNAGETVRFKISVEGNATYTLKIYRIGYYNGNGARLMLDLGTLNGVAQPAGISDPITGILDCSNWSESASWSIPASAVSGFYIAKIERTGGGSNHIAFIVRNDASHSDLYLQFPDATWQAYNGYGGNSLYDGNAVNPDGTPRPNGHAVKVSYNRPFFPYNSLFNTDGRQADWYLNAAYPMIRWLERNGYDVTYTSCNDVDQNGNRLLNHKVFISVGHDEYWSKNQRTNVEAARDAGVHLAFFSGNEVYWKTRWENNDGSEDRTLVCYKEGLLADGSNGERTCGTKCDDSSSEWTGLWRTGKDYDAGKPENGLTGQISWMEFPSEIGVPAYYKKLRFWRNTSVTGLLSGQTAFLGVNTLGFEWDPEQSQFAASYPTGRITMSNRLVNNRTHKLSLYRHGSGALVFGAGTVQWSWGLDGNHGSGTTVISPEIQQATVNLFADMDVQPATLQSGLVAATKSTDVIAPASSILIPPNGAAGSVGTAMTISGNAADVDGVVASVEVSVDGGATWRQAEINAIDQNITWNYTWVPEVQGNITLKVKATDDSGNSELPGNGITLTIGPNVCPCNIFPPGNDPVRTLDNDGKGIEVGVKFQSTVDGLISGIRYYKGLGTTGTHVGNLWSSTGVQLASATFINETAEGWQEVLFSSPVAITAGVTYVASAFSPSGDYASTAFYFTQAVVNGPLRGLADGEDGPNGIFIYTNTPAFPTIEFKSMNYWVDVVFTKTNNGSAPDITTQPVAQSVCPTDIVTFNSAANGNPTPTVQWQSTTDGVNWADIAGATSNTLSFAAAVTDNNKSYRAVWTNAEGSVFSMAALLSVSNLELTSDLTASVKSGESFSYTPASNSAGTSFAWSRAVVTGISNPAATGNGDIEETLINTTNSPINVTYEYTLSLNGCSNKQNVIVTVNPATGDGDACKSTTSIKYKFNSRKIEKGKYIWFNSSFKAYGISLTEKKEPVIINVTNAKISFSAHGTKYVLRIPDSRIIFTTEITSASTKFVNNVWETKVPYYFRDDVFMSGLSWLVPKRLPGNIRNIEWTADVAISKPGVSLLWDWSAAVYSKLGGHAELDIKPVDHWRNNEYKNHDDAGTPENYKQFLKSGATGKGRKDYTGHHSRKEKVSCGKDSDDDCDNDDDQFVKPPYWSGPKQISIPPVQDTKPKLEISVGPNPSRDNFTLVVSSKLTAPVTVIITDNFGAVKERYEKISVPGVLRFGDKLKLGFYHVEVIQGEEKKVVKVLKL